MTRDRWLTGLAILALLLVITNIMLYSGNRARQATYATRAQYIQQSMQLEPLYRALVQGIADRAASTNDRELSALLASQGISYSLAPTAPAKPPEPAAETPKKAP